MSMVNGEEGGSCIWIRSRARNLFVQQFLWPCRIGETCVMDC